MQQLAHPAARFVACRASKCVKHVQSRVARGHVHTRTLIWPLERGLIISAGSAPKEIAPLSEEVPMPAEKRRVKKKQRLDELCVLKSPEYSRNVIQSWIAQGKVRVDGEPVFKSGAQVRPTANIEILAEVPKYVCRAGLKMEAALDEFKVDVQGVVAMDAGLSTGGFTDCLLQRGAAKVYGVDVGYGQVAEKVRVDQRVVVLERTNVRHLKGLPEPVSLVTLDLSFISVLKVMPAICRILSLGGDLIVLIKPQFEARREQISRGGLVKDPAIHIEVIDKVTQGLDDYGFKCHKVMKSPIKGAASGNTEFLAHFSRVSMCLSVDEDLENDTEK